MLTLSPKDIVHNLRILNEQPLESCLDSIYKRGDDIHLIASLLLFGTAREHFAENQIIASFCISDAFLRTNKKKISLQQSTDFVADFAQQLTRTVAMARDIVANKISVGDVKNWFLWHVIDTSIDDQIWGFQSENKELINILSRFSSGNPTNKSIQSRRP